jgi:polyhydroxybutyrate depolymerase
MFRLVFILVLTLAGPAPADSRAVRLDDGRGYLIALPGTRNAPLVIALHGGGGNGAQMERTSGLTRDVLARGWAIAYPDGSGRGPLLTWNAGHCCAYARAAGADDLGFLGRVIADASSRFGIDPGRVFVTGMSNGGMMAERLAAERPDLVRAVASVAGPLDTALVPLRGMVPLLHIQGTADEMVPWQGGRGSRTINPGEHPAVEETLAAWRQAFGTGLRQDVRTIDTADDGMTTDRIAWSRAGREVVVLMRVNGGGHSWPGGSRKRGSATRDFRANAAILDFFAAELAR